MSNALDRVSARIEVTDLLATLPTRCVFRPHWSPQILDKVRRNLADRD